MLAPVKTVRVAEVTARIDELAAEAPGGVLAFDGDGTLWSGDVGEDFFHLAIEHDVRDVARAALAAEAREASLDDAGSGRDLALRLHTAYLEGRFSEERLCEIVAWVSAGWTPEALTSFTREVVERVGLRSRVQEEAVRVLEHARRVGIPVWVVSASPRAIVEAAMPVVGLATSQVIAVREAPAPPGGVLPPGVERPIPYNTGKVTRLRERIGAAPVYAAFGDNAFDVPMLREARVPVAIRPKPRLVALETEVPGIASLERIERV